MFRTLQAAKPLWTITPAPGNYPIQEIINEKEITISYIVQNQTKQYHKLKTKEVPGITQMTSCLLTPKGQPGSSCTIELFIRIADLPGVGYRGGPEICQMNADNFTANPNQCYGPSEEDSLRIDVLRTTISVEPRYIQFGTEGEGTIFVKNNSTSTGYALPIKAQIPSGSNIIIKSTSCDEVLAIGESCQITFNSAEPENLTKIVVSGKNTNVVNILVSVIDAFIIPVYTESKLEFTEGEQGTITIRNSEQVSITTAANLKAEATGTGIMFGITNATPCGDTLDIGADCVFEITSDIGQVGSGDIKIEGSNTNTLIITLTSKEKVV